METSTSQNQKATLAPGVTTPLVIQSPATVLVRIPKQKGVDAPFRFDFQGRDGNTQGQTDNKGNIELPATPGLLKVWYFGEEVEPMEWQLTPVKVAPDDSLTGVQLRCNNLGFYCGVVDGVMGMNTGHGISAFQTRHDLEVTGEVDSQTLLKLKVEYGC